MITKKYEIAAVDPGCSLELAETQNRLFVNVTVNSTGVKLTVALDREGFKDLMGLAYKLDIVYPPECQDSDVLPTLEAA